MDDESIHGGGGPTSTQSRRLSADRIPGAIFHVRVPEAGPAWLTYVSRQAEELFGQRVEPGPLDQGLDAFLHDDDRDAFRAAARAAVAAREPLRHEARCVTPSGETKWVECVAAPDSGADGLTYDGYLLDVTEQRRAEAEIHRLSVIVEQMGDALLITDRRGVIQYVNPAFEAHLGYSREEIVGKTPRVLKSGAHDDAFYRHLWDTVLSGRVYRGLVVNRHKNGRLVYEEKTISPLRDEAGRIVLFIATAKDVTAHRAAEAEARRSEERYRSFVAQSSEGIWRMESDRPVAVDLHADRQAEEILARFRVVECNDAFARMHGRARAHELTGAALGDLLFPAGGRDLGLLRAFVEGGYGARDHLSVHERRFLASSFNGVVEHRGLLRIWGVTRDVTAEHRAKESLRAMNEDLERRVRERTVELGRANAELARLASEDSLTGLANRRRFGETLEQEVRRARRRRETLSLLMCDVDHFKAYNDHKGHVEGDRCLALVARAISETFRRAEDLAARYGGEEFAVILPGVPAGPAARLADALRARLAELAIAHPGSPTARTVTMSIGVASAAVTEARDARWFVSAADEALYRSKRAGRDRVTITGL